jgi:hypothetical protein
MAIVLQTTTTLSKQSGNFRLVSVYSGQTNPSVTFTVTFTVTADSLALVNAFVELNGSYYYTDNNGQVVLTLTRGNYSVVVGKTGYRSQNVSFTILDVNLTENISLVRIGSFDDSYDDSFENQ